MKTNNKLSGIIFFCFLCANTAAQDIPKWKLKDLDYFIRTTDKPSIINFWATWCKPCVEEIPYFLELQKKYDSAGVKLILVSLDLKEAYPQKLSSFITKHKFSAPVYFLDETNADLFCPVVDKTWSGVIPATLIINNKKGYRRFFEEQISKENLEQEIKKIL